MAGVEHLLFLGAGASYGSEIDPSIVPPLAGDLFNQLAQFDPLHWGRLPEPFPERLRADFESGLLALNKAYPQALSVLQRAMAGFFFRYAPTANSLYIKLAKLIKAHQPWTGAIATLNYERMLLLALGREGIAPVCGAPIFGPNQVEVCLPHGCCNLFCDAVQGIGIGMTGMNIATGGFVTSVDHPDQFWARLRQDSYPPVMSYFEPNKVTTSGADFVEAQRHRLVELMAGAASISVIGIQVREQDHHIWNALASTRARIYYCSGNRGATAYRQWHQQRRQGRNDIVSEGYWSTDFSAIARHLGM